MLDETPSAENLPGADRYDNDSDLVSVLADDQAADQLESGADGADSADSADEEQITVKINGHEKQVTRSQLIESYQKGAAAGEKFEEAANLRKAAEQETQKATQSQQVLAQYIEQLDAQVRQWASESAPNWEDLLENNPHEYLRQRDVYAKKAYAVQQLQAAQYRLGEEQQAQYTEQLKQHLQIEGQKLIKEAIPEWSNREVREREEGELIKWLTDLGYSSDDLQYLNHSRAENINIARKAMLYDKAVKKAKSLKAQTTQAAHPVPTIGGKARAGTGSIMQSNLSFAEFVRRRQAQVAKRK